MKITFDPKTDGYHFSNNDIPWKWGPLSSTTLCGGMIYTALDYWWAGMELPQNKDVPKLGEPLQQMIYERQWAAHRNTVFNLRFWDSWVGDVGDNLTGADAGRSNSNQYSLLKDYLRKGQPMPVCLHMPGHGHHTLGIAASETAMEFEIYDPNYPDEISYMKAAGQGISHSKESRLWRGFFVDTGYLYKQPTMIGGDSGWRMCYNCRLIFNGGDTGGICPNGGAHYALSKTKYVLNKNAGLGQSQKGWKKCSKCLSLYFTADPGNTAGLCPDGGIHNPVAADEYYLSSDGEGQSNWRRCTNCQGLFWLSGGGIGGKCPAGSRHESDLTKIYNLAMA